MDIYKSLKKEPAILLFIMKNSEEFFEEKQLKNYKPEFKEIYYEIKNLEKKLDKEIKKRSISIDSLSSNSKKLYLKEQEKRKISRDNYSKIRSDRYSNYNDTSDLESYKNIEKIYKTLSFIEKDNFYKSFNGGFNGGFILSKEQKVNARILKAEEIFYGITNIDLKRKEFEDKIERTKKEKKEKRNNLISSLKLNLLKEQEKQKQILEYKEKQEQIFRKQEQDLLEEKRLKEIRKKEELDKLKTHQTAMLKRLEYEKSLADFKRDRKTRTLRRY